MKSTERDYWEWFCKEKLEHYTRYFYKELNNRKFQVNKHHRLIMELLDRIIKGEIRKAIIALPPRFGKTELAVKSFIGYGLAVNPAAKFIHLSYSDDLALDNSDAVREVVQSPVYQRTFPAVRIKHSSDSKKKWYTTEGGGVYATAAGGQVTGFGAGLVDRTPEEYEAIRREEALAASAQLKEDADIDEFLQNFTLDPKAGFAGALVIDDSLKPEDADNETAREKVNKRWDSTISNRVNSRNTPILYIGHRLHERDLPGHLIAQDGIWSETNPDGWFYLSLPAIENYGTPEECALWPEKLTLAELKAIEARDTITFERQYMQDPKPLKGRLYPRPFKTYTHIPSDAGAVKNVIDTADEGADNLISICYRPTPYGHYVTDVIYTKESMDVTEDLVTVQLMREDVTQTKIESNNGGRSFARTVEKLSRERGNLRTEFIWYHQSENKVARIFNNSATVQNMIIMPHDWHIRWPRFYNDVTTYSKEGKNAHDDAPDGLTMIIEAETFLFEAAVG